MAVENVKRGQSYYMDCAWVIESPAGFSIPCTVSVIFRWDEDTSVHGHNPDTIRKGFTQHFAEWYNNSDLFLALGFSPVAQFNDGLPPYCIPYVATFRLSQEAGHRVNVRAQPNEFWLTATKALEEFTWGSLKVSPSGVSFRFGHDWPDDLVQENGRMAIPSEFQELVAADQRYSMAVEYAAAKAQLAILEMRANLLRGQSRQKISTPQFRLTVEQVNQEVQIEWEMAADLKNVELLGFRQEGSFHPDAWAGAPENGSLQVHSRQRTGSAVQHLDPGKTYYYTFYVPGWYEEQWLGLGDPRFVRPGSGNARFTVRIPTEAEIGRWESLLKTVRGGPGPRPTLEEVVAARIQAIKERLLKGHLTRKAVLTMVGDIRTELYAKDQLSDEDKEYLEKSLDTAADSFLRELPR